MSENQGNAPIFSAEIATKGLFDGDGKVKVYAKELCSCTDYANLITKTCRTHYRGTFNDGTQFDSSYDRGEPLEFLCGAGMMIKGFDAAVANMEVGEVVDVHLMPSEAYGESDPKEVKIII